MSNVKNFVFSSSATVYGDPASVPITEDFPTGATTNPYGTTKVMMEQILKDYCKADPTMNVALLRYFNPIGAHESGLIGEDPNGIPNNLVPYIAKVAVGIKAYSKACGKDLPYVIDPRRPGDIAECYADPAKARDELGWTAEYGIEEMCASSWKWQSMNPNGYKG